MKDKRQEVRKSFLEDRDDTGNIQIRIYKCGNRLEQ